jgi:hypothetical protein
MKIIITESQYNTLFESNFEKNSKLIYKMWNDGMDLYNISDYTGLDLEQILFLLKDKEIYIDCGFAYQLVSMIFSYTDLVNKRYFFDDDKFDFKLSWDGFSGTLDFDYNDKHYNLKGMATPYWDGNCYIPVDGSYFEDKRNGDYTDSYDNTGLEMENTPSEFNSIQELIDFLNNDYPTNLIKQIEKLIQYYKD